MRTSRLVPSDIVWYVVLTLIAVYFAVPIFWLLVSITKNNTQLFSTFGLWFPPELSLTNNLRKLATLQEGIFFRWFLNSAFYSFGAAVLGTFVSMLAGYAFAKHSFRFRETLFMGILGSLMVPFAALVLPVFLVIRSLGWINTWQGFVLPAATTPFGVYFMRIYIEQAVPDELLDAARIDGAPEWRLITNVIAPVVVPGVATLALLIFVGTWNNFFLPLVVFSKSSHFPLSLGLVVWQSASGLGSGQLLYDVILTGSFLSLIPLIVAFLLLQRYWMSGLTLGALR